MAKVQSATDASLFSILDGVIVAAGVAVMGAAVLKARRGGTRGWRWLPEAPAHRLEAMDLIAAMFAGLFLPALCFQVAALMGWVRSDDRSTSAPSEALPDVSQALCLSVAGMLSAAALLAIGRRTFAGGLRGWGLRWGPVRSLFPQGAEAGDSDGSAGGLAATIGLATCGFLAATPLCWVTHELTIWALGVVAPAYQPEEHVSIRLLREGGQARVLVGLTLMNAFAVAPIVEELLFRGILQPALAKASRSGWIAIVLSGGLFGLTHLPYADTIPALSVFGVLLGWLYARTGSLALVIVVHALFNGKTLAWLVLGAG